MAAPFFHRLKPHQRAARAWVLLSAAALALFLGWPELDLIVSGAAWQAGGPGAAPFAWGEWLLVHGVYLAVPWFARLATLACLVLIGMRWQRRRRTRQGAHLSNTRPTAGLIRWQARAPMVLAALVLGLALLVNAGFKDHWGRPRPVQVIGLGGTLPFRTIAQPSQLCDLNCSFPTGHGATGFVLMAAGLRAAADRRRRWAWAGLGAGLFIGLGRVLQGGHFASDVTFAGLMIWGTCLLVQRAAVRGRAWRLAAARRV